MISAAAANGEPAPSAYRNDEFGIRLTIPGDLRACVAQPDQHDSGMSMFFQQTATCGEFSTQRFVGVSLSYNLTPDTETLTEFAYRTCHQAPGIQCRAAPNGLSIPGAGGIARRLDYPNGWVDIDVMAQAWPDVKNDPKKPFINYEITLHTTPAFLSRDLSVLRKILRGVTVWSPL
jgi:hypothetical protein